MNVNKKRMGVDVCVFDTVIVVGVRLEVVPRLRVGL